MYDRFLEVMQSHPVWVLRMERIRHERVLRQIDRLVQPHNNPRRLIEVGVGTGAFAACCRGAGWIYTGVDRNETLLKQIGLENAVLAEVPPFPDGVPRGHYDVAYSAFVLEHMADGLEAYRFIQAMSELCRPNGVVVLLVPDCLTLGIEFWNLDYTHRFPTTERNVSEIALDAGLEPVRVIRYRGPFVTGGLLAFMRLVALFFRYRIWAAFFGHKRLFYSVFQYVNQELLFLALARRGETAQTNRQPPPHQKSGAQASASP
ncbi:MAG: class I SAM-dependent methyltransferase [bacterium]